MDRFEGDDRCDSDPEPASDDPWAPMSPRAAPGTSVGSCTCTAAPASAPPGRDPTRPERRPRGVDRPVAGREVSNLRRPQRFAAFADRLAEWRWPARRDSAQGMGVHRMFFGPDPLAERLTHVARPLRHQQPQGQRLGPDAPPERDLLAPVAARSAGSCTRCSDPALLSGSTHRTTPRGTRTKTWPAS